jgi:hypothetical protein
MLVSITGTSVPERLPGLASAEFIVSGPKKTFWFFPPFFLHFALTEVWDDSAGVCGTSHCLLIHPEKQTN